MARLFRMTRLSRMARLFRMAAAGFTGFVGERGPERTQWLWPWSCPWWVSTRVTVPVSRS